MKEEHTKKNCPICLNESFLAIETGIHQCYYCLDEVQTEMTCTKGHVICQNCLNADFKHRVIRHCLKNKSDDPSIISNVFLSSFLDMKGETEEYFLITAVMVTAICNYKKQYSLKEALLEDSLNRFNTIPVQLVDQHGTSGAALAAGAFYRVVGANHMDEKKIWQNSNLLVSRCMDRIARLNTPPCMLRDILLVITICVDFVSETLLMNLPFPQRLVCQRNHSTYCPKEGCIFLDRSSKYPLFSGILGN